MNIPFCEKCGKMLVIKKFKEAQLAICDCESAREFTTQFSISESRNIEEKGEGVVQEILSVGFPHKCKKCGYEECDVIDLGAQYTDESNIILYKCKKCMYTERQHDGSGNN